MRIPAIIISALLLGTATTNAQTVATFDDLSLSRADTYYVNYATPGADVGFNDGLAHFPCFYDTSFGSTTWSSFAYSNLTDSVTSGYGNQYAAKTARGYDSSANYVAVAVFDPISFANSVTMGLRGAAAGHPVAGFYITNSTYAYNSMHDGDAFARKFHNGDWFKLTVQGYNHGALVPDSVTFYLADFLFPDTTMNYIVKTWEWVDLLPLGRVDSLQFSLSSTDNGAFGMNTPSYFCMDNFTTNESTALNTGNAPVAPVAKVYPCPARDMLYADVAGNVFQRATVTDMAGRLIDNYFITSNKIEINTSTLLPGSYILQLYGNGTHTDVRFVKQ